MIFNWSFGTALAAALTVASLCVIAVGLETTRQERRARRELTHRAQSLTTELSRAAERGVLDRLSGLLSETQRSVGGLIRWVQAELDRRTNEATRPPRIDPGEAQAQLSVLSEAFHRAARPFQEIVSRAERIPADVTLMTDDANVTISALFTASNRLEDTTGALERVERDIGFDTPSERLRNVETLELLSQANETIERAVRSVEDLAEAVPRISRPIPSDEDQEL